MAIKEVKRYWESCQLDYVKEFLCHTEKDVEQLPACCVGSKAYVNETGNWYACGKDQVWKLEQEATEEGGGKPGGTGAGLPSDVGAYKYMATDGEGKWVAEQRLAWKSVEMTNTLFWDGKPTEVGVDAGDGTFFYKLSDSTPTVEQLVGGKVTLSKPDGEEVTTPLEAGNVVVFGGTCLDVAGAFIVVPEDNTEFFEILFPEKGIYSPPDAYPYPHTLTIDVPLFKTSITHKISPEYLPEGIGYKEDEKVEISVDSDVDIIVNRNGVAETFVYEESRCDGNWYRLFDEPLTDEEIKTMVSGDMVVADIWDEFVSAGHVTPDVTFADVCLSVRVANANVSGLAHANVGTYFWVSALRNGVTYGTETIHPIPAEYLPQPIVFATSDLSTVTCNKTADEVIETIATNAQTDVWLSVPSEGVNLHAISNAGNSSAAMFTFFLVNSKAFSVTSIDVTVQNGEFTVATTTLVQPS